MVMCCIVGCTNNTVRKSDVSFHKIPSVKMNECEKTFLFSLKRRALWLKQINRKDLQDKDVKPSTMVCSKHFVSGKPAYIMDDTNIDWIPNLHLGWESSPATIEIRQKRDMRRKERNMRKESNLRKALTDLSNENCLPEPEEPPRFKDASVQTDLTMEEVNYLEGKAMAAFFTESSLAENDYKVKYYTGLYSFALLKVVLDILLPHLKLCERTALTKFQEFFLVLMRLRLALQEEDLAFRFSIHQSTVSRIMDRWLPCMAHVLKHFIVWPDRESLRKTMPECFQDAFGKSITVIIDCFEVFCERPSSFLIPRAQTYSSYKHHNTVKILMGITPQGTVSFVSLAWGGRSSDKCIVENCGILDKLIPGDVIMADRGFDIAESVGLLHARVLIPAFKGTRLQLSADEIEMTREIAHVRIHIERVIGLVRRKFRLLESTLHHSWLTCAKDDSVSRIDNAVIVCCALSNLCPPIIPMTSTADLD